MRWILVGTAFVMLVQAIDPVPMLQLPFVAASFALAWTVGFLALFAPAGIGVREVALIALLENVMPTGTAVIVAVLSRLWWILAELSMFAVTAALTFAFRSTVACQQGRGCLPVHSRHVDN